VGAFVAIGGKAALLLLAFAEDESFFAETGVGAFADMGGKAAAEDAFCEEGGRVTFGGSIFLGSTFL